VVRGWPGRSGRVWPPGLPMPLTSLVGRRRDLAEVEQLVASNRLVTLVGSGGVGKTRLAIEEAAAVAPQFADGVDLVDLSGVPDPALLWTAVARAVGVEEREDADLPQRLMRVIRPQRRLLVLDNCEHLLAASTVAATRLLACCPELQILATSREGLGVPGEVTWRVPSLTFPWPEHPSSLEKLEEFGAMALFADRARAVRPSLMIGGADIAAVSSICFRLDGIPLALELAAARVSALSITEIADRLDDQFTLLSRTVGGPARHQTLRASVDWSHQLLSQLERVMLRRLAVFARGWSLSAAEAVSIGPPVEPGQAARLLAALVDKSLVEAEDSATGTRYRLQEPIKAFAYEQLVASGELDDARARHGTYFADLGERVALRLHGPDQGKWARCLDQDQANLRAARLWCAADPARAALGLTMASGLGEYWLIRGLLEEGADWLHEALERAPGPARARAVALTWLAVITSLRGRFQRGGELFAASIPLHEQAGDVQGQARALALLGFWRANQADREGAAEALDRALVLAGLSEDRYFAAHALLMAGMAASLMADTALARTRAAQSVDLFTEIGDYRGACYARCVLADCLVSEGVPSDGLATLRVCIDTFEVLLDRWGLLISTGSAALAQAALGDWRQVAFVLGVADSLSERIGGHLFPGVQAAVDAVAAKTVAELGAVATPWREAGKAVGRGDRIAVALELAPGQGPPDSVQQDLPLTPRENEITQLIAGGLTNRQIAERLFIAQRTVDTHVGHILAKLSCSNRSQVAAIIGVQSASGSTYVTGPREKIRTSRT
jgi:predicted ATPase/DNA-binding CsgD family transcriptional regulator